MEQKKWSKPELIVLVRSKPEETVLAACKSGQSNAPGGSGPGYTQAQCEPFSPCSICSASTGS